MSHVSRALYRAASVVSNGRWRPRCADAVKRRLIGFDAVKHLLLARNREAARASRPVALSAPAQPFVAATRSADYATLLAAGAGHG